LRPVLDQWLLGPIEHVGSTAIPGIVLHLMSARAARWDQQLRFRDSLRANPALRDEYAAIKLRLASTHAGDRERYTDEKAAFVAKVMRDLDAAGC
jgi:GrpB-like predicted nucleotidyltransferase (UPF0157 family)